MINHLAVSEQDIRNSKYIDEHFKNQIDLFNRSYDLFLESISESENKLSSNINSDFHKVHLAMCMKINGDVRTILVALRCGWHGTAHTLFRDINDALVTIALITKSPEYAIRIINGKFKNDEIKKEAKKIGIVPPLAKREYGRLSSLKHAEGEEILAWYGRNAGENIQLRFFPTLDAGHTEIILLLTCALIIHTAIYYLEYHIGKYGHSFVLHSFENSVKGIATEINELMTQSME